MSSSRRHAASAIALAIACLGARGAAEAAWSAPPAAGIGFGQHVRTIDGLQDVRAALPLADGTLVAALGSGGVVRVRFGDGEEALALPRFVPLVAPWPEGGVAEAVALAPLGDGRVAVVDRAGGAVFSVATEPSDPPATPNAIVRLASWRPSAIAASVDRLYIADGARPRIRACAPDGSDGRWFDLSSGGPLVPRISGVALGGGVLLATDAANHRIVLVDPETGDVRRVLGDRGAFPDLWQSPAAVAWDGGAFLVTDLLNHRVVRVDADGRTLDQWGQHAVRPREGNGRIHYPTAAHAAPDGSVVAVAEPFERRVQLFGHLPPRDPSAPRATALPAFEGVASHFSREVAVDGRTLVVWEPESASGLVFDLRPEIPIHVTTFGGPGTRAGSFGQVSAACVDEAGNRIHVADPVRRVHASLALVRAGQAPSFDPFMPRLVREASFAPVDAMIRAAEGPEALPYEPIDLVRAPDGAILALDANGPRLVELDASWRPVRVLGPWTGAARPVLPAQCAIDRDGSVLVVDAAARDLKRYARADGAFLGATPLPARRPVGVAVLPDAGTARRLAIADAGGDRLIVVDPAGGAIVASGGVTGTDPGALWQPSSLAWSPEADRLFVSDHGNHRLQSFDAGAAWLSTFGIGRAWVRPKDPSRTGPVNPSGSVPSADGAADTRAQFPVEARDPDGWRRIGSTDGTFAVRYRFVPDGAPFVRDPFGLEVELLSPDGGACGGDLEFDAAMPHHGHGMNVAPTVTRRADGRWLVEGALFHMPGYWEVHFDRVDRASGARARAQTSVTLE
jgi:DNA-binding beta-propeller fold protein YncE